MAVERYVLLPEKFRDALVEFLGELPASGQAPLKRAVHFWTGLRQLPEAEAPPVKQQGDKSEEATPDEEDN